MPKKSDFHYPKDQQVLDAAALLGAIIFGGGALSFIAIVATLVMIALGA